MQFLELPLEIIRVIVACTVRELGLNRSMKARLVCRFLADEILDAVIRTRVIEDVDLSTPAMVKIDHHLDVITRYLYHRISTDVSESANPWIAHIRGTSRRLTQYTNSGNDPAKKEMLEWSACACLAANRGSAIFDSFIKNIDIPPQPEDGFEANCPTVAAWMGDLDLVKSLHKGLDSISFFGRPSWAAATQGHLEVLQFCLDKGALPNEPAFNSGPNFGLYQSPLAAAAYMGREAIVHLYLQLPYYRSHEMQPDESIAIYFAAQGNQANTLKMLLEHVRPKVEEQEWLAIVDWALVCSCRRGASASAKIALTYGADVNETDGGPRSCLQLAAISGSAPLVELLLDAGASMEATNLLRQRSSGTSRQMRKHRDALTEARKREYPIIVWLLEERQRILARNE